MAAPMKKSSAGKVAAKQKAKSASPVKKAEEAPPAKEKAPPAKEKVEEARAKSSERKEDKTAAATKPKDVKKSKTRRGKANPKAGKPAGNAQDKAKASPNEGSRAARRTKARRLEEAQAAVDGEDGEEGAAEKKREIKKKAPPPDFSARGVVYIGHIPEGFFEPQMKTYFSQFGTVTRLRHSRSKKNGNSKGYGWVEFEEDDVAKIAQQTMNGYLLFGKKLVCEMVAKDKVHPALFKNCNKKFVNREKQRRRMARETQNNRPKTLVDGILVPRETTLQHKRRGKNNAKLMNTLKQLEVKFDLAATMDGAGEGEDIDLSPEPAQGKKRPAEQAAVSGKKPAKKVKKA